MSGAQVNNLFNPSTSSQCGELNTVENEDLLRLKESVTKMLKSRIFLGRYYVRRFIDLNVGFRDIVKLSPAEEELKRDLLEALRRMRKILPNTLWIGISDAELLGHPRGVCIWTEINNKSIGAYWFQIKSVKFQDYEVIITLKCIRHITDGFLEYEPLIFKNNDVTINQVKLSQTEVFAPVNNNLTLTSIGECIIFNSTIIIAIFRGILLLLLIYFLYPIPGNFILALDRELSKLITK